MQIHLCHTEAITETTRQLIICFVVFFLFWFQLTHLNLVCIISIHIVNVCKCHQMTFLCTMYCTLLVHLCIFVLVYTCFIYCTPTHTAWCLDIYNLCVYSWLSVLNKIVKMCMPECFTCFVFKFHKYGNYAIQVKWYNALVWWWSAEMSMSYITDTQGGSNVL